MSVPSRPQTPLKAQPAPVKPQQPAQASAQRPASPIPARKPVKSFPKISQPFLFDRENYLLMGLGVALIFIGFVLMSGGKSPDPHQFLYNEIYSFRRITLAPIVVLLGYAVEVFAIMKKPKDTGGDSETPAGSTPVQAI